MFSLHDSCGHTKIESFDSNETHSLPFQSEFRLCRYSDFWLVWKFANFEIKFFIQSSPVRKGICSPFISMDFTGRWSMYRKLHKMTNCKKVKTVATPGLSVDRQEAPKRIQGSRSSTEAGENWLKIRIFYCSNIYLICIQIFLLIKQQGLSKDLKSQMFTFELRSRTDKISVKNVIHCYYPLDRMWFSPREYISQKRL